MITISLCMIVKNEEKTLARCLDSLEGLTDEIIIIDTGSTDRTMQIGKRYGAMVYQFPWTGSFADARNFSFSKASMDYIYAADADEVLDETNRIRFLQLKNILLPEIEIVQMMYCNQLTQNTVYNYDREYRPKLFKRIREFSWVEPIHETVSLDPIVYDSDIEILHLPLSSHSGRDFRAFLAMEEAGQRLSKRLHHMYAQELYIAGKDLDFIDALPVFLHTMPDLSRTPDEIKEACCVIARASRLKGDIHTFFTHVLKNIVCESCSEICCELGAYYADRSDWEEAAIWYQNAAYETECILCLSYKSEIPLSGLSECCSALGNTEQALNYKQLAKMGSCPTDN